MQENQYMKEWYDWIIGGFGIILSALAIDYIRFRTSVAKEYVSKTDCQHLNDRLHDTVKGISCKLDENNRIQMRILEKLGEKADRKEG